MGKLPLTRSRVKVLTGGVFDFNRTKMMWQNKTRFRLGVIGSTGVFGALSLGSSPRGGAGETRGKRPGSQRIVRESEIRVEFAAAIRRIGKSPRF